MSRNRLPLAIMVALSLVCGGLTAAHAAAGQKHQGGQAAATTIGVTGVVKTSAGAVLSGATVTAGTTAATTGTDGKYTLILTAGTYSVSALKTGYTFASASVRVSNAMVTTNFTAAAPVGITGVVKSSAGALLSGATVTAGTSSATTGTDGKYTLTVPAGTYAVSCALAGYSFASASVKVSTAVVTTNFTATAPLGITGVVKTAAGTVLSGATITAGSSSVATGTDGKYTLGLPAGTYTVSCALAGYTFASASVKVSTAVVTTNFTAVVPAQDGVVRYWAVVVGINTYQSATPLKYCVNDANDMVAALTAGGYPAANIKLLTDAQATKTAIQSAIAWMATQADADDVCVYYHSSHGDWGPDVAPLDEADGKDEYLCTYNTNSTRTLSIRDDELGQWIAALKTTKYVVFLDTCYAGGQIKKLDDESGWGASFAHAVNGMSATGKRHNNKDLDDLGKGVVIAACADTESSQESASLLNGVFTYYLTQGMTGAKADANKNGWYSAEEVYNYSAPLTHAYNSTQTVAIYDAYPGELDFAKASAAVAVGAKRSLTVTGAAVATSSGASAIMLSLSAPATVSASIVNLAGREVGGIGDRNLSSGLSTLLWNGKSRQGTPVPAGQYLVRLRAKDAAGNCSNCLLSLRK